MGRWRPRRYRHSKECYSFEGVRSNESGIRTKEKKMGKLLQIASSRRNWAWPYVLFMALFVVLPLILVAYYAFTDIEGDFTLRNITKFFTHSEAIQTFLYSLMIAVFNTILCLLIGYPAAYIMASSDFRTPKVMAMLFILCGSTACCAR